MNITSTRRLPLAATLLAAVVSGAALAQPDRSHLRHLDVEALKIAYLACDAAAMQRLLGAGEAAECSMIYEEFKQRAFGGDFMRLLAWWREQAQAEAAAARTRYPLP